MILGLLLALTSRAVATSWYARAWQTDEGLPNNTVASLAQTPDGYLWLGTPSGLARFDGLAFEEFSPSLFIAPPNRGVIAMNGGAEGSLWLAMDRGALVRLKGDSSLCYTAGLPPSIPNSLTEDQESNVWVAYRGGAVYRLDRKGQVSRMTVAEGLPEGSDICALVTDTRGRTWFAKAGCFGVISNGLFVTAHRAEGAPVRLAAARDAGLWLCRGHRLLKLSGGSLRDCGEFQRAPSQEVVTAMLEDSEGAVWIGTSFSGLFRFNGSGFEQVETTHREILALLQDREGNLWAGTQGGGLNRIRRHAINLETAESGLPFPAVQSICEDTGGTVWAVTQNGYVARRGPAGWSTMPTAEQWPREASCVTADPSGGIWLGTRGQGLYRWREGHFENWGDNRAFQGQTLHTLLVSHTGDLWAGGEDPPCLLRLGSGQLRRFEAPPDSRVIRAITEDRDGNIWAGTSKGVLLRLSGEQITEVTPRPFRELAPIRSLHGAPDGALWIGYAGWGLGRLKDGLYAELRSEHGLYDDYLSHILADDSGWFWFGANRGIFKVREKELIDCLEGRIGRVRSVYYGRGQGLPSLQAMFGNAPGALRSRDGRLWLPMRTALAVVNPRELREKFAPPAALVSQVAVDEQTVASYPGVMPSGTNAHTDLRAPAVRLRLSPRHRHIEFRYSALNFSAPENIQFRCRLTGFDEDWVDAGSRRVASYSRLPAGTYQFEVLACNMDGRWSSAAAGVGVVILPFWYHTWWFRGVMLALFTLCIVTVVRYMSFRRLHTQLRVLVEQTALHKERARIAKDIHDDVGANLTQIGLLGELAREDPAPNGPAASRIERMSGLAREAIKSLDEIVWAVNPRNDTLAHCIDYTAQYALDYLRSAGVRCRLDLPDQVLEREVSTDVRHNLFLIVKEALNNVVKHAGARTVWLRVQTDEQQLRLMVEDDGCGFTEAPAQEGADGFRNMRQRAADIGGHCDIRSRRGHGTTIMVSLSWSTRPGPIAAFNHGSSDRR